MDRLSTRSRGSHAVLWPLHCLSAFWDAGLTFSSYFAAECEAAEMISTYRWGWGYWSEKGLISVPILEEVADPWTSPWATHTPPQLNWDHPRPCSVFNHQRFQRTRDNCLRRWLNSAGVHAEFFRRSSRCFRRILKLSCCAHLTFPPSDAWHKCCHGYPFFWGLCLLSFLWFWEPLGGSSPVVCSFVSADLQQRWRVLGGSRAWAAPWTLCR